jgi:hypothetical protein
VKPFKFRRRRHVMGKFVVVHPVGKDLDAEAMTPVGKAIKAACTADAYWARSTYLPEEGKLYCQWDAKDADAIREVMAAASKVAACPPVEGIYAVGAVVRGEDFRS